MPHIWLFRDFYLILFDDGVGKNVARQGVDIFVRLLAADSGSERDLEELALPHLRDALVAQPVQRRADSLALRIEDSSFQGNKYASLHSTYYSVTAKRHN